MSAFRTIVLFVAVVSLSACAGSPTEPGGTENYQGQWVGQWVQPTCTESGAFVGVFCSSLPATGGGLVLTLTQLDTRAEGTLMLGVYQLAVSGPVNTDGSLSLAGQGSTPIAGLSALVSLVGWRSTMSGNRMAGSLGFSITVSALSGFANINAVLQDVTRR